jgi:hypothetical protein
MYRGFVDFFFGDGGVVFEKFEAVKKVNKGDDSEGVNDEGEN